MEKTLAATDGSKGVRNLMNDGDGQFAGACNLQVVGYVLNPGADQNQDRRFRASR
jgi:hypothetical protein